MTTGVTLNTEELIKIGKLQSLGKHHNKKINNHFTGNKLSKIKGHGIDFDEVREYQFGDDIRSIDWKTTAKLQKTYIKTYKEEKQRQVFVLVDFSNSMYFASKVAFKSVICAKVATLIAFSALKHNDKIGAVMYNENNHYELKAKNSKYGVQNLISAMVKLHNTDNTKTSKNNFYQALLRLKNSVKPGSLLFIISDFYQLNKQEQQLIQQLTIHNDIIFCFIYDDLEKNPPPKGSYLINNNSTIKKLNIFSKKDNNEYKDFFNKKYNFLKMFTQLNNMQIIAIKTDDDLIQKLSNINIFHK